MPIPLRTLASAAPAARLRGDGRVAVSDVAYDSRAAGPGALFFCVPGARADGHDFAPDAVRAGAVALVTERELDVGVPQLVVPSAREAMAPIAAEFFGHPSRAMSVVGVTGTNGKTTTTYMLESVIRALGWTPGLIGTVDRHIGDAVERAARTTPEAIDLQRLLARMRDAGVRAVGMEASSEGLVFGRVEGTRFACAVFTNLSRDHLNTHGTMEAYFDAKALLFRPEMSERAAINLDDGHGRTLARRVAIPVTTFSAEGDAEVRLASLAVDRTGSSVEAVVAGERIAFRVRLPARHNVSNALGVLAVARALGWPLGVVAAGIEALRGVPGRLEPVDAGQDFTVLVDYAHTPDSLESVLRAARAVTPEGARLVVVFGCGGDRDRTKRAVMGRAGAALADRCIITSDNPRSEDPGAIVAEIEAGARESGKPFVSIVDRREAIAEAIRGAAPGDVVVIAGKGHESGQEFADRVVPFDDRDVARELVEELWSR